MCIYISHNLLSNDLAKIYTCIYAHKCREQNRHYAQMWPLVAQMLVNLNDENSVFFLFYKMQKFHPHHSSPHPIHTDTQAKI